MAVSYFDFDLAKYPWYESLVQVLSEYLSLYSDSDRSTWTW